MEVTLAQTCSRCGKTKAIPVTVEKVMAAQERQKKQETYVKTFIDTINDTLPPEFGPEVVICYRSDAGYGVRVLNELCDTPEGAKKRKGCKQRVLALLDDIFVGVKKTGAKKKPAPKKNGNKDKSKGKA